MLLTKRANQCTIRQTLSALMMLHPIPHAIFLNHIVKAYSNFASLFSVIKDTSLAQTSYVLVKNSPSK